MGLERRRKLYLALSPMLAAGPVIRKHWPGVGHWADLPTVIGLLGLVAWAITGIWSNHFRLLGAVRSVLQCYEGLERRQAGAAVEYQRALSRMDDAVARYSVAVQAIDRREDFHDAVLSDLEGCRTFLDDPATANAYQEAVSRLRAWYRPRGWLARVF